MQQHAGAGSASDEALRRQAHAWSRATAERRQQLLAAGELLTGLTVLAGAAAGGSRHDGGRFARRGAEVVALGAIARGLGRSHASWQAYHHDWR